MTTGVTISQPEILMDGSSLDGDFELVEITVENDLHRPDAATILFLLNTFEKHATDILDKKLAKYFRKGVDVEIRMSKNGGRGDPIFVGEVSSIGTEYRRSTAADPLLVRVTCYDNAQHLTRVRESNTYLVQTYSDIVKKVAGSRGLRCEVDATTTKYDHVVQADQTPWEFVNYMASRVGYDVYVNDDTLYFKKPQKINAPAIELRWGETLSQFNASASVAFQVGKVQVRGWDPKNQKAIVGKATTGKNGYEADLGEGKSGPDIAHATVKADETFIGNWPVFDQKEANTLAEALAYDMERDYVHAEGVTTIGMPEILPRKLVDIKGVGKRFDGKYLVTSTTHRYDGAEGYTTSFTVGGSQPNNLLGPTAGHDNIRATYPGVVIAVVTNIKDPDGNNRVKVKYPWLSDGRDEIESDWARIAAPDAGKERGFQWLPEINDEVLVAFEHGDINRPYILGGLWSTKNRPPMPGTDIIKSDKVAQRVIKSSSGHSIILIDEQGKEQIIIRDKTGKNEIIIDSKANTLTINVDKDITLKAGGKIDIEGAQAISISSAQQDVTIDCANFKVNAKQGAEITANTTMTLKSNGPMSVESSATTAIKGTMVNIG